MRKAKRKRNGRRNAAEGERPDATDLGGESEDSLRRAHMTPEERADEARHERLHDEGIEPGPEDREELSTDADDLGRRYLEDATQQPRRERPRSDIEREGTGDEPLTTMGEEHIREMTPGAGDGTDPLVTHLPDRTEHEEKVSDRTREMQREARDERRSHRRDSAG